MIFVTVGTHHDPFDRLLNALDALSGSELVVQHGPASPPPGIARAEAFMPFDAMLKCFREADAVITHAGVGSILCATREGHVPVVAPRRHDLGEHVDDHQLELTRALADRGAVIPVLNMEDLPAAVAGVPPRQSHSSAPEPTLCVPVREALLSS